MSHFAKSRTDTGGPNSRRPDLSYGVDFSKEINSRPISYQGGWTIMQKNDFNRHSFHSHFSPSINYSLGYRGEYWRKKEWTFHGVQLNYLVKRFNGPNSQANIYLKNALGFALSDYKNHENKPKY